MTPFPVALDMFLTLWGMFIILTGGAWLTCLSLDFWRRLLGTYKIQRRDTRSEESGSTGRIDAGSGELDK